MHVHRQGSGDPLVLLHGIGHHWQAWSPVLDELAGDFAVVACESPGFGRSPALPAGGDPDGVGRRRRVRGLLPGAGTRPAARGRQLDERRDLARAGPPWRRTVSDGVLAGGVLDPRRAARMPRLVQPAVVGAARTAAGRTALFAQLVERPAGAPAGEVVSTLRDAWAAPVFTAALKAFDAYAFTAGNELDNATVCVAGGDADRLLPYGRQAARAKAAVPYAQHVTPDAGHLPFTDDPAGVVRTVRETTGRAS